MPRRKGDIEVICGSMFSGKTEELLRRLRLARVAGQRTQLFKPVIDDRYSSDSVVTHDGTPSQGATNADDASDLLAKVESGSNVVGVDEAHFFDDRLVDVCIYLAHRGKRVVAAGLDQDYRGNPFRPMPRLMAVAADVTKMHAICIVCKRRASRTQRLINGQPARIDSPLILIGGKESYEARCSNCHSVPGKIIRRP
ncbi:MAG: thymidine kinase [Caldilineaceae bacterium]|nr:thymidine kinase [Caldilineaceae bacterium]